MLADDRPIGDLAQAVLDGETVDWGAAESKGDRAGRLVGHLKVVAAVAEAHRNSSAIEPGSRAMSPGLSHLESWGHLRVSERIGQGAFGAVYQAWDSRLDRDVALKLIPVRQESEDVASSVIAEGRLLARVRHPNVVTIHGADQIGGYVGLWMELVPGRTLEELLLAGSVFGPVEVARIGVELARALDAVHSAGLLHRDIKAQNVMREDNGRIVLMDFGTGRELADERSDLTGTPLYLAPELFHGQVATRASDVYSLGVLLYHLLTRTFPVEGRTISDVRVAHEQNQRTGLRVLRPDVSLRLALVIERAISPRPEERYPTAESLCADLKVISASPPRRWIRFAAAAIAVLTGFAWSTGVTGLFERHRSTARGILSGPMTAAMGPLGWLGSSSVEPSERLVSLGVDEPLFEGPLLSPNGENIAYTTRPPGGELRLYVKALSSDKPTLIATSTQFVFQPFFSPDSSWIGFFDGGRMWKASVRGGDRTTIAYSTPQPRGASWGDDGFILYAPRFRSGLWRVSARGGEPREVTTPDAALGETGHAFPSVLPGSRVVIFRAQGRSWQESTLVAYSFDTSRRVSIVRGQAGTGDVATYSVETASRRELAEDSGWARSTRGGQLVYLEGSSLVARQFDPSRLDFTGPRIHLLSEVSTFSLSDAGSLLYRNFPPHTPNSWLVWVNRDGTFERVPGLPPEISHVRVCPADPGRLVFERYEHVFTYDAGRGTLSRITSEYSNKGPVWTPGCDRVFFSSARVGQGRGLDLSYISADGSGNKTLISEAGAQDHVDIARNGKWLAYETKVPGVEGLSTDIWLRDLNNNAVSRPLAKGHESKLDPALSPDGRWVAYASKDAAGRYEVYVRAVDGPRKQRVSPDGGREPVWNPNGKEIFYRQGNDKLVAVDVRATADDIAIGRATVLFAGPYMPPGVSSRSYDVSADGNRFLMVRREPQGKREKPTVKVVTNWLEGLKRRVPTQGRD